MTIQELEDKIWDVENIRIVVRAGAHVDVGDYNWVNAAQENWSISDLLNNRIRPTVGDHDVVCVGGSGLSPHGRTLIRNVRRSYR